MVDREILGEFNDKARKMGKMGSATIYKKYKNIFTNFLKIITQ